MHLNQQKHQSSAKSKA